MLAKIKKFGTAKFIAVIVLIISAWSLIAYSTEANDSARSGLILCGEVVIPALFPFFVVSSFAIELGAAEYAAFLLERFMRSLFGVGGVCTPAFVLGIFGGYPIGAKTAVSLYEKKLCSKTEAERLLAFCNNSGPAFILGAVGAGILKDGKAGVILYAAHIAAAVTTGIIFRFYKKNEQPLKTYSNGIHIKSPRLSDAFINSVKSGLNSILNICAFVTLFSIVIRMLQILKIIPVFARGMKFILSPFGISCIDAENFTAGLVEVTSGLWAMSSSQSTIAVKMVMSAFILGWAGLSVHCQVLTFVKTTDLSTKPYFIGKLISAVIASIYTWVLLKMFPLPISAASGFSDCLWIVRFLSFPNVIIVSTLVCVFFWCGWCFTAAVFNVRCHNKKQRPY